MMQPMVRVVATAFDYKANEILRWDDKWDVGSGAVSIDATAERGHHNDPTGARTLRQNHHGVSEAEPPGCSWRGVDA